MQFDCSDNLYASVLKISNAEKVRRFMDAFGQDLDVNFFGDFASTYRLLQFRRKLVEEELQELDDAIDEFLMSVARQNVRDQRVAFLEMVDALVDLLYVVYGFLWTFGVCPDEVFDIVHRSNMSKLGADGQPIYREDGKVLKGPQYRSPDFTGVLNDYLRAIGASDAI